MEEKLRNQINVVNTLSEMLKESIDRYINHDEIYSKWRENRPKWESCNQRRESYPERPTKAELRRITLMLRQETIKLDKLMYI